MNQYMFGEEEEGSNMIEEMDNQLEEDRVGPTSIDVTDEQILIGPTSIDVTDAQLTIAETTSVEQEVMELEESKETEQVPEQSRIDKGKQKRRRITSYLSNISKQIEKQGNQINKLTIMIQSLQRQKQTKSNVDAEIGHSKFQSIKQIQSQISQLQKRVTRIQKDIQRIRTIPTKRTNIRLRKPSSTTGIKPRSKKGKSLKNTRDRKGDKKGR
jgi:predicted  nucleic acid-binding Zn-ribbon protein